MKKKTLILLFILICFLFPQQLISWDGYDYDKGTYIEIEKGNKVRAGETIEIYDYSTGEYKDVEVDSVSRSGNNVEIEVTDSATGETRTLDMDK